MYDKGKIIAGIVIFAVLVTFPIWFTGATGNTGYVPKPKLPEGQEHCVEATEYMKSSHMDLLNQWRDAVVRDGKHVYTSKAFGTKYPMSLSDMSVQSCMSCHNNKEEFCDQCHNYVGVTPYCWDCHLAPGQGKLLPTEPGDDPHHMDAPPAEGDSEKPAEEEGSPAEVPTTPMQPEGNE